VRLGHDSELVHFVIPQADCPSACLQEFPSTAQLCAHQCGLVQHSVRRGMLCFLMPPCSITILKRSGAGNAAANYQNKPHQQYSEDCVHLCLHLPTPNTFM